MTARNCLLFAFVFISERTQRTRHHSVIDSWAACLKAGSKVIAMYIYLVFLFRNYEHRERHEIRQLHTGGHCDILIVTWGLSYSIRVADLAVNNVVFYDMPGVCERDIYVRSAGTLSLRWPSSMCNVMDLRHTHWRSWLTMWVWNIFGVDVLLFWQRHVEWGLCMTYQCNLL